jgi:hypothetical protein
MRKSNAINPSHGNERRMRCLPEGSRREAQGAVFVVSGDEVAMVERGENEPCFPRYQDACVILRADASKDIGFTAKPQRSPRDAEID